MNFQDEIYNVKEHTVHSEHYPFADGGRHAIGRDAQIGTHMLSIHFCDIEARSFHARNSYSKK